MITLAHFDWQTPIEFDKNLQCLIIENPECFYETVNKLNKAIGGEDCGFILTDERQKEFTISKSVDMICDYVALSLNDKKILTPLYKKLQTEYTEYDLEREFVELQGQGMRLLDSIIFRSDFDLIYGDGITISDLFKVFDLRVNDEYNSPIEKIVSYVNVKSSLSNVKLLILVNASCYFNKEELNEIAKHCEYKKIAVLLIESAVKSDLPCEKVRVIDRDLCEFTLAISEQV